MNFKSTVFASFKFNITAVASFPTLHMDRSSRPVNGTLKVSSKESTLHRRKAFIS